MLVFLYVTLADCMYTKEECIAHDDKEENIFSLMLRLFIDFSMEIEVKWL